MSDDSWPALPGYRRFAAALLVAAIASFLVAALTVLSARGTPVADAMFWIAVVLNVACFVGMPLLLLRVISLRRLERLERRLFTMRAVWGGPFGALGAIRDLTGTQRVRAI